MENKTTENIKKCYNSWSCLVSAAIIVLMFGSIIYDMTISKPEMRKNISEIRQEVQEINQKIDAQQVYFIEATEDSVR